MEDVRELEDELARERQARVDEDHTQCQESIDDAQRTIESLQLELREEQRMLQSMADTAEVSFSYHIET